jgi:serine-type D-Ala-D-Ala carboxypeptidase
MMRRGFMGRKIGWYRVLLVTTGVSLLIPATAVGAGQAIGATVEVRDWNRGGSAVFTHTPPFPWDKPGVSSPVLHPGTPVAAGMSEASLEAMNPYLEQAVQDKVMPGAVVLIARKGQIVKHQAYGNAVQYKDDQYSPVDQPIPMEKDTIFDVASISKIFTTTAAMKLYEEGKFQLDDPVTKYIPEFAANGKEGVTIRQLMTHTSGFEPFIPLWKEEGNREGRLQAVFAHPLKYPPGTTYVYSDLNMITLGALVEKLSGMRQDAYVKKVITEPLGMKDTMYNPPASLKPRIAATEYQPWTGRGLVWGEVHDENAASLDGVAGHAGVFSTAHDLAVFAHTMLNKGKYGNTRILKPETVDLMEKNQTADFPGDEHGLGWELKQGWFMDALSDIRSMGHTGFTGTSIVINRNNGVMAILLTNRVHPTRKTVSTNPVRRQVARLTADAIPVAIPGDGKAWFAGYGDKLDRSLATELDGFKGPLTLTFETWYRTDGDTDYGVVEVSENGYDWKAVSDPYTESSEGWKKQVFSLPEGARFIRFRYHTDDYANGRGWYVQKPELKTADGQQVNAEWSGEGWEMRDR